MNRLSFFNINAAFGKGAYDEPDFSTPTELLAHLDYLEIDRSLVWHVEARDMNPTWGNRRLLKEITDSGAEQRLFPTFAVTPACFYENGTMDFLRENLSQKRVRTLRVFPAMARFPLRQIERVLRELTEFEPVLLWDCPNSTPDTDFRGLIELAGMFPQINFVVTQKMWPEFGAVLDAMWRCDNISVDISWLHMRDMIELLVEHFGAKRILFGTGHKAHYGAATAMLMHARISEDQRELIAHGNIERILDMTPVPEKLMKQAPILSSKPMWKTFRSGNPITETAIIDAHSHTGPHTRGWFLRENDPREYADALLNQMNRLGINRTIVCPESALFGECLKGNTETAALLRGKPDRFSGYVVYNPRHETELLARLDSLFANPFFVGFKLLPAYWRIALPDARYTPVWQYAEKHSLPILMHTWDDSHNSPAMLNDIAGLYPHAKFILGHSGGGTRGRLEAEALALEHNNVFLEFCGSFTTPRGFEISAERVGWDKVIFGSDAGAHSAAWELGRYLSMPVSDECLKPGLSKTFEHILEHADTRRS